MSIDELFQKACQLHQAGELERARSAFVEVVRFASSHDRAAHLAGVTCLQLQDVDSAIKYFQQAIQLNSQDASYHLNLSVAFSLANALPQAIAACRRGIALEPQNAKAHHQLARLFEHSKRRADAIDAYRRSISLDPNRADTCRMLAKLLMNESSSLGEAMQLLRRSVQLDPNVPEAFNELGYVLQRLRRHDEAIQAFSRALELKPVYAQAWNNISTAYRSQRRLDEAEKTCREAIRLEPKMAEAIVNLGIIMLDQSRFDEAIECFKRALKLRPDYSSAHSRLLYCMQYLPGITPEKLLEAHRDFDVQFGRSQPPLAVMQDLNPNRPLRVGLVSEGFGKHPVGHFLLSFISELDSGQVRLICFSDRQQKDDVSDKLRHSVSSWYDTAGKSTEELCQCIQNEKIDILFDLDGHAGSRMLVFARKPAPIQISWMGYVGTTGLQRMDYVLADRWEIPNHLASYYSERIIHMPRGYVCYAAPEYAPCVGPLPYFAEGKITFGCFNQPSKVNSETMRVWSQILMKVPHSRMRLQYKGYESKSLRQRIHETFLRNGISSARILLHDNTTHGELLDAYNSVDIGLDTFPYSGGLTTCEALWMGVPIITNPGDTFASRHSFSHLNNVCLKSTIAASEEEYISIAIELANDVDRLQTIRSTLREQMKKSALCDGQQFARDWMSVVRKAWVNACEQSQSK